MMERPQADRTSGWLAELDAAAATLDALRSSIGLLEQIADVLATSLRAGGTIYTCGNGGSALEAEHFAAELVGHFGRDRAPLRCTALPSGAGLLTALANDYDFRFVFSRQLEAFGGPRDALLAFTTSGTSPNVVEAVRTARSIGMPTIALTGSGGGLMPSLADHVLVLPGANTQRAREAHLLVVHLLAGYLDGALPEAPA
jgi:D-sedoheptulose 7-phosphate isomerase